MTANHHILTNPPGRKGIKSNDVICGGINFHCHFQVRCGIVVCRHNQEQGFFASLTVVTQSPVGESLKNASIMATKPTITNIAYSNATENNYYCFNVSHHK